jgi:glucose/arabinose dehydrogenase
VGPRLWLHVNAGEDPHRAAIRLQSRRDRLGSLRRGTRNPIGIHFYPGTDTLYAAVQERDELGDDLVPDFSRISRRVAFLRLAIAYADQ